MSHFTVMVVGDVDHNLAPFHEFECTGKDDDFIQNISKLDELKSGYETNTSTVMVNDATGEALDAYDNCFYREPTSEERAAIGSMGGTGFAKGYSFTSRDWGDGKGYSTRIHYTPDGWREDKVPVKQSKTFKEFCKYWDSVEFVPHGEQPHIAGAHKYGYGLLDAEGVVIDVIRRTNPNKKWDWYVIGGRWKDFLLLKNGKRADWAYKEDIDFDGMRDEGGKVAGDRWDKMAEARDGEDAWVSWDAMREAYLARGLTLDDVRKAYHEQPAIERMSKAKDSFMERLDDYLVSREEYVATARASAITTFAFCMERNWVERGEMGWWGISINEVSKADWAREFSRRIDALPNDAMISIVDCHI
jgi:hypothetical protein